MTKPIENVNGVVHQKMMEEKVVPAIKLKWPTRYEIVWVQQDNTKPHS